MKENLTLRNQETVDVNVNGFRCCCTLRIFNLIVIVSFYIQSKEYEAKTSICHRPTTFGVHCMKQGAESILLMCSRGSANWCAFDFKWLLSTPHLGFTGVEGRLLGEHLMLSPSLTHVIVHPHFYSCIISECHCVLIIIFEINYHMDVIL